MKPNDDDSDCCIDCHFDYEDEFALPHVPRGAQELLRAEHRRLMASKDCMATVRHAAREMILFRKHCPAEVVARIDADHGELEPRLLKGEWPED